MISGIIAMDRKNEKERLFDEAYPIIRAFYCGLLDPADCLLHHQKLGKLNVCSIPASRWRSPPREKTSFRCHLGCIQLSKSIFEMEFYHKSNKPGLQRIIIGERSKQEWRMIIHSDEISFILTLNGFKTHYTVFLKRSLPLREWHHFYIRDDGDYIFMQVNDEGQAIAINPYLANWIDMGYPGETKNVVLEAYYWNFTRSEANYSTNIGDMALFSIKLSGKALVQYTTRSVRWA